MKYKFVKNFNVNKLIELGWEDDLYQYKDDYKREITIDMDKGYEGCFEICKVIEKDKKHVSYHNYVYTKHLKETAYKFYLNTKVNNKWTKVECNEELIKDLIKLGFIVEMEEE